MHILSTGKSALQGESNRLRSRKSRGCVDNDCLDNLNQAVEVALMGSFEVVLNRREVLEHWQVEMMSIGARICRQESEVDRIRMKRVTCG